MAEVLKKKYYFSFGIDCAPGTPRPDVYAEGVFEHIGVESFEADSKLFGAWEWHGIELDLTEEEKQDLGMWMKSRMDNLYESGKIRGAQWEFDDKPQILINTMDDLVQDLNNKGVNAKKNQDGSVTIVAKKQSNEDE